MIAVIHAKKSATDGFLGLSSRSTLKCIYLSYAQVFSARNRVGGATQSVIFSSVSPPRVYEALRTARHQSDRQQTERSNLHCSSASSPRPIKNCTQRMTDRITLRYVKASFIFNYFRLTDIS